MDIEIVKNIPLEKLIGMVRDVPLLQTKEQIAEGVPKEFVYKDAQIELGELCTEEVNPTTFYLLEENLQFQRDLREHLIERYGIDSLHLKGAHELHDKDKGQIWTLIPPVIEVTKRRIKYALQNLSDDEVHYDGVFEINIPIINDGAHRVSVAREANETFNGIFIIGADSNRPFYAHPNSWDDVRVVQETPKNKREKKLYSRGENYALYRDFGVLGCGAPRKPSG